MLIKLEAKINVLSRKTIYYDDNRTSEPGTSVFKIAYITENKKMMSLLMKFISEHDCSLMQQIMLDENIIRNQLIKSQLGIYLLEPLILLDNRMLVTWDMLYS